MSRLDKAVIVGVLAAAAIVGGLVLVFAASYDLSGDEFDPPPKPMPADLQRLRDRSGFPVFWLGPAHGEMELNHAEPLEGTRGVMLRYGGPYCDSFDETCNYDVDVITTPDRAISDEDPDTGERTPICWRRVGRAHAFGGCPDHDPTLVQVFTGSVLVEVRHNLTDGEAHPLVGALRPMDGGPLPKPKPLGCRETRRLSARLRRTLPAELRGCRRP